MIPLMAGGVVGAKYAYDQYYRNATRYPKIATRAAYRQVPYRKKDKRGKYPKSKLQLGQIHSKSFESAAGAFLNQTIGLIDTKVSDISLGDTYTQRNTNNVLSKYVKLKMSIKNNHTVDRHIRVILLTLRGSIDSADTANWTDLFISNTFVKTAYIPGSSTSNITYKVNQDEYKVITDKLFTIRASGETNDSMIKNIYIPTKKIIKYEYNSTDERRNPMYLLIFYGESANTALSTNKIEVVYRIDHKYIDVQSL